MKKKTKSGHKSKSKINRTIKSATFIIRNRLYLKEYPKSIEDFRAQINKAIDQITVMAEEYKKDCEDVKINDINFIRQFSSLDPFGESIEIFTRIEGINFREPKEDEPNPIRGIATSWGITEVDEIRE